MILGLDVFAKSEFAKAIASPDRPWKEICREFEVWFNPFSNYDTWNTIDSTMDSWTDIPSEDSQIERC